MLRACDLGIISCSTMNNAPLQRCHQTAPPCRIAEVFSRITSFSNSRQLPRGSVKTLLASPVTAHRRYHISAQRGHRSSPRTVQCSATAGSDADIDALQAKFGIEGHVEVTQGRGGLPMVRLQHSCGATAEVYLFGGLVLSWKMASGDEVLYTRPDAKFDKSKPISGGIPHCFPQFGPGELQQHGFARNLDWQISSTSADLQPDERDPQVELVLTDNDYTRAMWPYKFKAVYSVHLHGENLVTDLRVLNEDDKPFDFTAALHSYFEVLDISKAKVFGLQGLTYLDKVKNATDPPPEKEERKYVEFSGPVDSVYLDSPGYIELDVGTGAAVAVSADNWPDVVVWSPWTDMKDCYQEFCCVENAKFKPVTVQPGSSWRGQTTLEVKDLDV